MTSLRRIRRHDHLAREGERQSHILVLKSGWAGRYRILKKGKRHIAGLFLPGEYCEPKWAFDAISTRPIIALTDVIVEKVSIARLEENPFSSTVARFMIRDMARAADHQFEWIVSIGSKSARERLCSLLLDVSIRWRSLGHSDEHDFPFPLTLQETGDATGMSAAHAGQILRSLNIDTVRLDNHRMIVIDPEALRLASAPVRSVQHQKVSASDERGRWD